MLEKFTKKDKRTNLEKEIDELKIEIDRKKGDLDKSNSVSLDYQIESLFEAMSKVDPGSEDYLNMAKAQDALHKAKANVKSKQEEYLEKVDKLNEMTKTLNEQQRRKDDMKKTVINIGVYTGLTALWMIFEKGDVITGKVWSKLPWPKI
jgi:hypothetical protein